MTLRMLLATTLLMPGLLHAAYTVQIGAFRNPSNSFVADARLVATVYVTERSGGVKALSVGSYESRVGADQALDELQVYYPDAYVATLSDQAMEFTSSGTMVERQTASVSQASLAAATSAEPAATSSVRRSSPSANEQSLLDRLSESERRRVVYLDGILHVKTGTEFVPLRDYQPES